MADAPVTGHAPGGVGAPRRLVEAGDIAPRFALADAEGRSVDPYGDDRAGRPQAVVFCPDFAAAETRALLAALQEILPALKEQGAEMLAVTRGTAMINAGLVGQLGLGFPVLADPAGESFRLYGLGDEAGGGGGDAAPATFLIAPNLHLRLALREEPAGHAARLLESVSQLAAARQSVLMAPHPPVLIVPDVLSPADCQRLMTVFAMEGNVWVEPGHGDQGMSEDYKMRVHDYGRQDRIDHWVMSRATQGLLMSRIQSRLFPEIQKAFHYTVTRSELFRIACYEGERGGKAHGHRDNSQAIGAHRRFAVSINLNCGEFEGGTLRFPEFGDQRYCPDSGAAIAFSCSLLHEALPVTSGRRFVVLAFLSGDR